MLLINNEKNMLLMCKAPDDRHARYDREISGAEISERSMGHLQTSAKTSTNFNTVQAV